MHLKRTPKKPHIHISILSMRGQESDGVGISKDGWALGLGSRGGGGGDKMVWDMDRISRMVMEFYVCNIIHTIEAN